MCVKLCQAMAEQHQEFTRRFEKLRLFKGLTIAEAAKAVGLSRTMIHWIKAGRYEVTQKNWMKLQKAETEAGFSEPAESGLVRKAQSGEFKTAVLSAAEKAKVRITPEDMDRGVVELPLIYRRGEPPAGMPSRVKIRAPNTDTAAKIVVAIRVDEDLKPLFRACLEEKYAQPAFMDLLSPFSYEALREACLTMAMGRNWKRLVPEIVKSNEV
jgi:transcriptional regulator with XRE-family HTH domain